MGDDKAKGGSRKGGDMKSLPEKKLTRDDAERVKGGSGGVDDLKRGVDINYGG